MLTPLPRDECGQGDRIARLKYRLPEIILGLMKEKYVSAHNSVVAGKFVDSIMESHSKVSLRVRDYVIVYRLDFE